MKMHSFLMHFKFLIFSTILLGIFSQTINKNKSLQEIALHINLLFYNGSTSKEYEIIPLIEIMSFLSHNHFDSNNKSTMFYCPGYMQKPNARSTTVLINSYLDTNSYNTFEIDWSKYSINDNYFESARDSYYVGKAIAVYFQKFLDNGIDKESIEIVGISLGAQMAGSLGQNLRSPIRRIVGLDPAGPGFSSKSPHFSKGAAKYTIAIHTDMGGYGTIITDADLDIIVNGGHRIQPGCPLINIPLSPTDFCSHGSSLFYWADLIKHNEQFTGFICKNNGIYFSHDFKCTSFMPKTIDLSKRPSGIAYVQYNGMFWLEQFFGRSTNVWTNNLK